MRICLYTETALPMLGGQELVVDGLARQYVRMGHEVVVLAPRTRSSAGVSDRPPYRVVRHPRFLSTWRFVEAYRWWLVAMQRRFRFDVVHCHSVHPTGHLAVLARRITGVPVVITSHGGDVHAGNRRFSKPGVRDKSAAAVRAADALVAIGRFTSEGYLRLAPDARGIVDIPNGVDVTAFAEPVPRPAGLEAGLGDAPYLLFIGRLSTRKGVDVLLDAYARMDPATRPLLVVAGDGEERERLVAQAGRLGLAEDVRFAGKVLGAEKLYLLQNALAVVLPSREWEAFPLVVLEAFACGRPVVATRIPGLQDLVRPGLTGWLVDPQDAGSLAAALTEAAVDEALRRALGHQALEEAKGHDWPAIAMRHIAVYERVISARKSGVPSPA